jgi:hypothetical protein
VLDLKALPEGDGSCKLCFGNKPSKLILISWIVLAFVRVVTDRWSVTPGLPFVKYAFVLAALPCIIGVQYFAGGILIIMLNLKGVIMLDNCGPMQLEECGLHQGREMIVRSFHLFSGYLCPLCGILMVPPITSFGFILTGIQNIRRGNPVHGIVQIILISCVALASAASLINM